MGAAVVDPQVEVWGFTKVTIKLKPGCWQGENPINEAIVEDSWYWPC